MRDSQRGKVYAWEREVLYPTLVLHGYAYQDQGALYSLDQCEAIVTKARARYGLSALPVGDGSFRRRGMYLNRGRVELPRHTRHIGYVCHEATHSIVAALLYGHRAAHGPEFVRVFLDVLDALVPHFPMRELRTSLRDRRIRVATTSAVPRPRPARVAARLSAIDAAIASHRAAIRAAEADRLRILRGEPSRQAAGGRA